MKKAFQDWNSIEIIKKSLIKSRWIVGKLSQKDKINKVQNVRSVKDLEKVRNGFNFLRFQQIEKGSLSSWNLLNF